MPLGAAPDLAFAVLGVAGDAGVGLDIALVHGLGGEVVLDHHVSLGEGCFYITDLHHADFGDV